MRTILKIRLGIKLIRITLEDGSGLTVYSAYTIEGPSPLISGPFSNQLEAEAKFQHIIIQQDNVTRMHFSTFCATTEPY